jgi:hypothetical protein
MNAFYQVPVHTHLSSVVLSTCNTCMGMRSALSFLLMCPTGPYGHRTTIMNGSTDNISGISEWWVWVYRYTHGTHLVSSRKPRRDPAENPIKYPVGTWRPSGPQGPGVHHRVLWSQPCTTSKNTGEAIRTLVPIMSPLRPPSERANVQTYVPLGKSRL